jgi:hypothetical protein
MGLRFSRRVLLIYESVSFLVSFFEMGYNSMLGSLSLLSVLEEMVEN